MRFQEEILIGIYCPAFADIAHLTGTLNTIELSTGDLHLKVIVFADGFTTIGGVKTSINYVTIENKIPEGKAYCFNRLISYNGPDFFVFIEAGILLGPDCLSILIGALKQNDNFGLAGPSTNRCWNEQSSLPSQYLKNHFRDISRSIKNVYQTEYIDLAPLYSLSDFCYAVKKKVIKTIGIADEAYGTGSCWEMDFNIRAARSGLRGIWVKAAFAERTLNWPFEDLQRSKQLYQKRFCVLQKNQDADYKSHCLGDGCSNFAVLPLEKLKLDLPSERQITRQKEFSMQVPLVSCIMPTSQRSHFIEQAIEFFVSQDYPQKELVIVYNTEKDLPKDLDLPNYIKLVETNATSIGEKRNEGCANSNGSIIVQWDDDDIYYPNRISAQIAPIRNGECEITGLNNFLFYEECKNTYWVCSKNLFERLFVENVAGGTLVFLKSLWENISRYPPVSLREDCTFLESVLKKGVRLQRLDGKNLFIYFRHSYNSWRFNVGDYLDPNEWKQLDISETPKNFKLLQAANSSV